MAGIKQFTYGLKLVATWMLIPFVVMFIPQFFTEFSARMTTQEVVLLDPSFSYYPEEYSSFKTDINGKERVVHAPVTSRSGDTITVVMRNGDYYLTPMDDNTMKAYTTIGGRFIRVCDNIFGYHVIGIASVLLVSFVLTVNKRKAIREICPRLAKVTDITGIVLSVIMSALLLFAVIEQSLTGIGIAYLGLFAGIGYTGIFVIAWLIESLILTFAKKA